MDPRMDSRGVLRGKCTSCDCEQYDGGEAKKKCVRPTCSHPPGKHLNLSNPSELRPNNQMPSNPQVFQTSHGHPASAYPVATHPATAAAPHGQLPQLEMHWQASPGSYYQQAQVDPNYMYDYYYQPNLPPCAADGCEKPVYYDQMFGAFKYCSPECRNKHLLPTERENLKRDIAYAVNQIHASLPPPQTNNNKATDPPNKAASLQTNKALGPSNKTSGPTTKTSGSTNKTSDPTNKASGPSSKGSGLPSKVSGPSQASTASNSSETTCPKLMITFSDTKIRTKPKTVPVHVFIRKSKEADTGIIVSNKLYVTRDLTGFLITGVSVKSKAYDHFTGDKLRFHDVITFVDGKPVKDLASERSRTSDVQELFDSLTHKASPLPLTVEHSVALPPTAKYLSEVKDNFRTHFVSMGPPSFYGINRETYGLDVHSDSQKVYVQVRSGGTPSCLCGLKFEDELLSCLVTATDDGFISDQVLQDCCKQGKLDSLLKEAARSKYGITLLFSLRR